MSRLAKNHTIRVIQDSQIDAFRLMSTPRVDDRAPTLQGFNAMKKEVRVAMLDEGAQMPATSPHVPRPANSFILYRQHLHQQVTDANPGVPNTEICE